MLLIDSHCHINLLNYNTLHINVDDVVKKAYLKKVKLILSVCTKISDYYEMTKIIKENKNILLTCGIHPIYTNKLYDFSEIEKISNKSNVIALGETGLDYLYKTCNKNKQQETFIKHINIGNKIHKPLIIHNRKANNDIIEILKKEKGYICRGVLHCFNEDISFAKLILDLDFYISFSGIITFKNTCELHKVIKYVPLNRILLETDSPYLTPYPFRGRENQPAYIYYIADCISTIKKMSLNKIAYHTSLNFSNLFKINLKSFY